MTVLTPAVRALRATPGFSAVAILTMAVAIAANTAIFSTYDQIVLHPVTLPDPSSLMAIWIHNPQGTIQAQAISIPRYDELKDRVPSFSSMAASTFDSFTLTGHGEATQLNGLRVTPNFFSTLGILPARGRGFTAAEDTPNGPSVCVISHELWLSQLGGRDAVVGESIELNGTAWVIVGIMPPRLTAPFGQVQVFTPRVFENGGLTPAQIRDRRDLRDGDRAAAAWRHDRAGAGRDGGGRSGLRGALSWQRGRPCRNGAAAVRRLARDRRRADDEHVARRCRLRPAHRVRQRRVALLEPPPETAQGDRRASLARRHARRHRAAVPRGKPALLAGGRRARRTARCLDAGGAAAGRRLATAAQRDPGAQRACVRVRRGGQCCLRRARPGCFQRSRRRGPIWWNT